MLNKNMAKEWQKGWYRGFVGFGDGNEVVVRTTRGGKTYEGFAKCCPDDEFSLSEGMKIAMARLEEVIYPNTPNTIKVGDRVRIKLLDGMYCGYTQWIIDNVTDPRDIAVWQYDNAHCDIAHKYLVKYIGLNKYTDEMLAYITEIGFGRGYLFNLNSLEKIDE